tara:strand:- start:2 stop:211 length:210 start_codon:yes stop_codon:yes gene_type:complete
MKTKDIRIMQVVAMLLVNNAFILLAVADIEYLKFALLGGWAMVVIAGIYLAKATDEINDNFDSRYRRGK